MMMSEMQKLDLYYYLACAGVIVYLILLVIKIIVHKILLDQAVHDKLAMEDDDPDFDREKYENWV